MVNRSSCSDPSYWVWTDTLVYPLHRPVSSRHPVALYLLMSAVDDLRFVAPQTAVWNSSVFNATTLAPACLQPEDPEYPVTSEDCLYLNVFTPPGTNATNAYLPVMVWM